MVADIDVIDQRAVHGQMDAGDGIQLQMAVGVFLVACIDVDFIADLVQRGRRDGGAMLEEIFAAFVRGLFVHPDEHRVEFRFDARQVVDWHDDIAAGSVHFVVEREDDGHGGEGVVEIAVPRRDGLDGRRLARRQDHDFVSGPDDAGGDGSREAAEVEIRADDILDREAHVDEIAGRGDVDVLQMMEERRAIEPRHVRAWIDDVVALKGGDRNEMDVLEGEAGGHVVVVAADFVIDFLRPVDQIHLVDGDDDMDDAEQ